MKRILLLLMLCCIETLCYAQSAFKVLVFSKTAAFRHQSIPAGIKAIEELGLQHNFGVDKTEDANQFTASQLRHYAAVIFLNTTGDILNASQQEAFEQYIRSGGGYVGIHSASDTEYEWSWYGDLVGRYFDGHPAIQTATLNVSDESHPATSALPKVWERSDEWYNFSIPFPAHLHVLLTVDESTYSGGTMGNSHPIAWYHLFDGGRSFYTAMGHTAESYEEPLFRQHLLGGILWAANIAVTSAQTRNIAAISVYPNPASNVLQVNFQQFILHIPVRLAIYDVKGRRLIATEITEPNTNLDISLLPGGLYFLQITGEHMGLGQKLLIQK